MKISAFTCCASRCAPLQASLAKRISPQEESDEFRQRIEKLNLPQVAREKLLKECDRLAKMPYGSHEGSVMRVYLRNVP